MMSIDPTEPPTRTTKPTACDRCGCTSLILGTATQEGDGVALVVACKSCGRIQRATVSDTIAALTAQYE